MEHNLEEPSNQWVLSHVTAINLVMDRGYCQRKGIEGSVLVTLSELVSKEVDNLSYGARNGIGTPYRMTPAKPFLEL